MKLNKPIYVTTIEPGTVWTAIRGSSGADREPSDFWRASPQEAAQQIADAIEKKRKHAYVHQALAIDCMGNDAYASISVL